MKNSLQPIQTRLALLRNQMQKHQLSAYLVTNFDPHHSEYSADHWLSREWVSGFTGSAGDVVITPNSGGLWTDGRYFIQAVEQLKGTGITLFKRRIQTTPTISQYLAQQLPPNSKVGVDGRTINYSMYIELKREFAEKSIELVIDQDLIGLIWEDRPERPSGQVFNHPLEFSGESSKQKIDHIRQAMCDDKVDQVIISAIDDVMWLMNIRGQDSDFFPGCEAYALISQKCATLFIDQNKLPLAVQQTLQTNGIQCLEYKEIYNALRQLPNTKNLKFCPRSSSSLLINAIPDRIETLQGDTYAQRGKIVKNATELEQLEQALTLDGSAIVKFMYWLDGHFKPASISSNLSSNLSSNMPSSHSSSITEISAQNQLRHYRQQLPHYISESFNTIAGYAENGALMHYHATEASNKEIGTDNFFLVDSGGQYLGGTTDITRTFSYGELTEQQRIDYTLVLKGVIRLSQSKFLQGTTGCHLDILARGVIWQQCVDYKCGTGHGVGICLNVHEGPQNFSQSLKDTEPLVPGMTITVEPGIYREGEYGIRIENILKVVPITENQFGTFYGFETLTLAPIATAPLKESLLSDEEKQWLNAYHSKVLQALMPLLDKPEQTWLTEKTQPI